jgi:thiol-disulfide isomerase/thioredoxin
MFTKKFLGTALFCTLLLSGCGGTPAANSGAAMADKPVADTAMADASHAMTETTQVMADKAMTDTAMADASHAMTETTEVMADKAMVEKPAWQTMSLTDVRTGQSFTLADFAGKTVYVEPMATWCPNCRQQLGEVKAARLQADPETIFIALSVETDLAGETLAQYANDNNFDWTFAVMTPDAAKAFADVFGPTILNPPSTPHFVIRPDGSTTDLVTGIESGGQIASTIAAAMK